VFVEVVIAGTRIVVVSGPAALAGPATPAGPAAPAGLAAPAWCGSMTPFYPKCILVSKNTNTTCGTLLVLKTCLKLVIFPSHFRDFDGRKLVAKTVNKLPQAERLLVLEQSLDLALNRSCIGVEKVGTRET
jgi:hypothetical protein